MKKILILLATGAMFFMNSCTTSEDIPIPDDILNAQDGIEMLGDNVKAYSNGNTIDPSSDGSRTATTRGSSVQEVIQEDHFTWEYPFDLIKAMPEGSQQAASEFAAQDYCFISNGQPFHIVALYSNGSYYHQVKMHYKLENQSQTKNQVIFDDRNLSRTLCNKCYGECFTSSAICNACGGKGYSTTDETCSHCYGVGTFLLWQCSACHGTGKKCKDCNNCYGTGHLQEECIICQGNGFTGGTWYDPTKTTDAKNVKKNISRLSADAPAYWVYLPAGTIFYFEIISYNSTKCSNCNGTGKAKEFWWSSNYSICTSCQGSKYKCNNQQVSDWYTIQKYNSNQQYQSATFSLNDWTVIGFEDMDYNSGDKDFNDVVIAMDPIQYTYKEPKMTGTVINMPEDIDIDRARKNQDEYEQDEDGDVTKITKHSDDEDPVQVYGAMVETNWAVNGQTNGKGSSTNYSKLSVHVRDNCNIKITLPIAQQYCCSAEDYYIVAKHGADFKYSNGNTTEVKYSFDGHEVTLKITHNTNNIVIESFGINEDIIKYLYDNYRDGVTFEVWTWLGVVPVIQDGVATIEFIGKTPETYLNRMNDDSNSNDIEFAVPTGFTKQDEVTFTESGYQYKTQIYKPTATQQQQ